MFFKSLLKIGLTAIFLLTTSVQGVAANFKNLNFLQDVISHVENGNVVLNIKFKKSVGGFKGPVFYPRSIQIDFLDTYVKPSKLYFPVDSGLISQVNVTQYDRKTVRIRLVLAQEGLVLQNRFHMMRDNHRLKIRIERDGEDILGGFLDEITEIKPREVPEVGAPVKKSPSIQTVRDLSTADLDINKDNASLEDYDYFLGNRMVKTEAIQSKITSLISPSPSGKDETQSESQFLDLTEAVVSSPPDLTESALKMFSMLVLVLGVMFLVLYFFKKFIFKNGLFVGNNQLVNVLGSCMLAPRKNITLVEVGGDVLVVGLSQDHMALLATIQDKTKIENIKKSISMKSSNSGWHQTKTVNKTMASSYQKPSKAAESFAKYVKGFSKKVAKPPIEEIDSLIQKKLGALHTA